MSSSSRDGRGDSVPGLSASERGLQDVSESEGGHESEVMEGGEVCDVEMAVIDDVGIRIRQITRIR
jgi:hypothetical protein